jgi:ATP-dependent Lon protease
MPVKKFETLTKKDKHAKNKKQNLKRNKDSDSDDDSIIDEESEYETVSESSESSYKPPKSKKNKNKRRVVEESEDEDDEEDIEETEDEEEDDDEDEDDDEEDDEEDEVVDRHELQKLLGKLFPSKYMQKKVENTMMTAVDNELKESKKQKSKPKSKSDKKKSSSTKKHKHNKKKQSKKYADDADDEEDNEEDEEDEYDEEEEDEDENGMYSIIFLGDDDQENTEEYIEDDEDAECDSDDEQAFMKETYQRFEILDKKQEETSDDSKKKSKKGKKSVKDSKTSKKDQDKKQDETELTDVEQEYLELVETKKNLTEQLNKKPKSKILRKAIDDCDVSIKKLVKKARTKNAKTYHKLIHSDKKKTNEIDYFKKKLSNKEQLRVMKDLKEINSHINIEKPYRLSLLDSKMPSKFKAIALQKLNILRSIDPSDHEYYKIKNWVDTFMRIPFGIYKSLSVKMEDGLDVCNDFMENAKNTLDKCAFGLNDAKLQIMQMMGQWISNPSAMGTAIAIKGPMGTGKTTLVKEGLSKILGREFAFIALGGAGDSSFLEGHSYTYEGSTWGKIVQIIIESKCMNPVIYFDELDKISDTPRGEEIIGILTHLTDTSQNSQFHDKYFSEIDFDLSKCLFIFSYNDESKVNPILKDRMYRIQTKGYDAKEKVTIARDYLLPKIREQVNFKAEDVIIPDETIQYIVSNTALTKNEDGVRNLKRCLEIIYTKLNLFRLVKPDTKIFGKDIDIKVTFPITVTKKEVDIFIKNEENQNQSVLAMYV